MIQSLFKFVSLLGTLTCPRFLNTKGRGYCSSTCDMVERDNLQEPSPPVPHVCLPAMLSVPGATAARRALNVNSDCSNSRCMREGEKGEILWVKDLWRSDLGGLWMGGQ